MPRPAPILAVHLVAAAAGKAGDHVGHRAGADLADGPFTGRCRAAGIEVVDGDTLRVEDELVRLVGFDAPEVRGPDCERERAPAAAATERLRAMIAHARRLRLVVEPERDFGRALARLRVNGGDAGAALIGAGLAHPHDGRGVRRAWCEDIAPSGERG